jgi:hypothetical protein
VGDEERPARVTASCERSFELVAVLVVVAGETSQVLLGQSDQAGGLGKCELVVSGAERSQVVGIESGIPRCGASFQLARTNPA